MPTRYNIWNSLRSAEAHISEITLETAPPHADGTIIRIHRAAMTYRYIQIAGRCCFSGSHSTPPRHTPSV